MWPWPWPQLSPELVVKRQASGQLVHCKVFYLLVVGKQNRSTPYLTVIVWVLPFNALYNRPLRYAKPYTGRLCMSDYSVLSVESRLRLFLCLFNWSYLINWSYFSKLRLLTLSFLQNVLEILEFSILPKWPRQFTESLNFTQNVPIYSIESS